MLYRCNELADMTSLIGKGHHVKEISLVTYLFPCFLVPFNFKGVQVIDDPGSRGEILTTS